MMLRQRVATAFILLFLLLVAIFALNQLSFSLFLSLIIGIAVWEWSALSGLKNLTFRILYTALLISLFNVFNVYFSQNITVVFYLALFWWLVALICIFCYPRHSSLWANSIFLSISGIFLFTPGWLGLVFLRSLDGYPFYILLVFALVAAADIGAYFSGKSFGKTKLALNVSPNKTWEGVVGGIIACCILVSLSSLVFTSLTGLNFNTLNFLVINLLAVFIALLSVTGDLFESMIKRFRDVKDSGNILPGHGGMLDRIDGLTSVVPLFVLFVIWFGPIQ